MVYRGTFPVLKLPHYECCNLQKQDTPPSYSACCTVTRIPRLGIATGVKNSNTMEWQERSGESGVSFLLNTNTCISTSTLITDRFG